MGCTSGLKKCLTVAFLWPMLFVAQNKSLVSLEIEADAYCRKGQWDMASEAYEHLIKNDPNTARYHYKLGGVIGKKAQAANVFKAIGLVDEAKASLSRALELRPNYLEVFWAQTELYTQLPGILGGGKSAALKYAQKIERLEPAIGALAQSKIYQYFEDIDKTTLANRKALQTPTTWCTGSDCNHANAVHFAYGKAAFQSEMEQEQGVIFLKRYCNDYSAVDQEKLEEAYFLIAQLSFQIKDFEQAKTYINLALSKQPKWKEALVLRQQMESL